MTLQETYIELKRTRTALLATNFYNLETLQGVVSAAKASDKPLILQLTRSSIDYMGINIAVQMARTLIKESGITAWIHLDHSDTYELVAQCLDAGFDSVMIDASEKPFRENISLTKRVVRLAETYNACVEAELGFVAKLGQEHLNNGFTDPLEARTFVEETGIHALAVAIGTAHGFYRKEPKLDLELLSRIKASTDAALVLHGGSGIPHNVLEEAVKLGICKVNLATEIKNIFIQTLKTILLKGNEIDLRKVFPVATAAVTELVMEKLHVVSKEQLEK